MMNLKSRLPGLITAILMLCLVLWAPMALAETNPSTATDESAPALSTGEQSSNQAQPAEPPDQNPQEAVDQPATPARSRRGKTYEQPPDPYNMEAIEAYDEEVYGAGR